MLFRSRDARPIVEVRAANTGSQDNRLSLIATVAGGKLRFVSVKTAMKERESGKERLSVLRMVWAAVRNKEIDEKTELTDDAVMAVLMKEVKQREDTIKEIKDANRPDLVAKNEEEIEILKKYLPEPLSDEELKKVIQDVIATTGAKSMKDMGKVMGRVLAQTQGRAAGSRVSALVKELLK